MLRIVFLDRATVDATFRPPSFAHEWIEHAETSPDAIVERLLGARIAITNKVPLRKETLEALPELEMIAVAATGTDIIDLEHAALRGIAVANVRNYAKTSVPEHAILLMLALKRNLAAYRRDVEAGEWQRARAFCLLSHPIEDLAGSTLGVIGYGVLGRRTAELAEALGMHVLIAEHRGRAVTRAGRAPFEQVIAQSDVISLHAPLDASTRGMIGARELSAMKRSAILINTARGGLVDEQALAEAILSRRIAGCGIDVLPVEPPVYGSAILALAHRPEVIVTPHVAWASRSAMQALADRVIDNIEAFASGRSVQST